MTIFTTTAHGTIHAPGHTFWHIANASRNAIRLAEWRERIKARDGRGGEDE